MRREFFDTMSEEISRDESIYMLFCGLGYPRYDEFKAKYPDRTINCEASEQTGLDMAVGLALSNRKPFIYTITPFFWRGAETIRTYISHENIPVRMVGAGRNDDYKNDGFSHDGTDIRKLMDALNIKCRWPNSVDEMRQNVREMIETNESCFLSLRR